jgi:hypothetical protein
VTPAENRRVTRSMRIERALAKLGTLAHNRLFSPAEFRQVGGTSTDLQHLVREGLVEKKGRGTYFPTPPGWEAIEQARPITHLLETRNGVSVCGRIIRPPEMRWTYQLALTTCKGCLAKKKKSRP